MWDVCVRLALLVLGANPMDCPNVGDKFRSQYLSHMMPNLGGVFSPLSIR